MCGLAGFWAEPGDRDALVGRATAMAATLAHRGPDDADAWADPAVGVALGFRRLAVVDLTPTGRQPMTSADGRWTVVFNGEIYNHAAVGAALAREGARFRGTSDTEVALAAVACWGVAGACERFNGMFAMALWDGKRRELSLIRDRLGKKPLYYGRVGDAWVFGSELKSFRPYTGWAPEIDPEALSAYLRVGYVPEPRAIFRGVAKVPPGGIVRLRRGADPEAQAYWRVDDGVDRAATEPRIADPAVAVDEAEARLRDAVGLRLHADVPLGAFLSGGVDSSTVVALMQQQATQPVRTFSIGFEEASHDEAPAGLAVARHLGTEHTEIVVTPDEARAAIPRLPEIYDEPFADASGLLQFLIAERARRHVTVALSGDGGDEAFGGYERHVWLPRVARFGRRVPVSLRRLAARAGSAVPPGAWSAAYGVARPLVPSRWRVSHPGDKAHKLAAVLDADGAADIYDRLTSAWSPRDGLLLDGGADRWPARSAPAALPDAEYARFRDLTEYLPGDILTKVDRATMAVGLEARAPLLDYRLIDWTWRLDPGLAARDGRGKWVLREILARHVPRAFVDRPKQGFAVPIGHWLRGPLRSWAEDLLAERRLRARGLLDPDRVRRVWRQHLSGRRNWETRVWVVLMLEAWMDRWRS